MSQTVPEARPFDPLAATDAIDHESIAVLRQQCPVVSTPSGYSYLTTVASVTEASRDVYRFEGGYLDTDGMDEDELFLPFITEPRHGKVRRVINAAIAAHRIDRIQVPLRSLCDQLLTPIIAASSGELIRSYVEPIPAAGIGILLGLPEEDHPRFSRWADDLFKGTVIAPPEEQAARDRAMTEISSYLDAEIAARISAENPPDDFITRLANTEVVGERLSPLACRTQLIFLLVAGTETTRNLIGNMILTLARCPDLLAHLRTHPEDIPAAIEESLRVDPPLPFLLRRCTADATVVDIPIDAGSQVAFGLASANRDETVFDDPDVFSIDRDNARRHLSFGDGPHVCPGASLARLEARIAIEVLVERIERLDLEDGFVYQKTPVAFTNGPVTLPIRVTPRRDTGG